MKCKIVVKIILMMIYEFNDIVARLVSGELRPNVSRQLRH